MDPLPNQVVVPTRDGLGIEGPHRVLRFDRARDEVVLIAVEPCRKDEQRLYFHGPRRFTLKQLGFEEDNPMPGLVVQDYTPRPLARLTNEQLNIRFGAPHGSDCPMVAARKTRYRLIQPLIAPNDSLPQDIPVECSSVVKLGAVQQATAREKTPEAAPLPDMLDPDQRRQAIARRAKALEPNQKKQIRVRRYLEELLNAWWAGGGVKEALTPYNDACGKRKDGKERQSHGAKLGCENALTRAGVEGKEGFVSSETDKENMRWAWRTYLPDGLTIDEALRRLWTVFYSKLIQDADGRTKAEWLPMECRPTRAQFERAGRLQDENHEAWKLILGPSKYAKSFRPLPSSARQDIVGVGQRGAIDSTPPDMQFVSILDPLRRIGGACRILLVESMYDFIAGKYLGLDGASTATVKLALLDAMKATDERRQRLSDLGLDPNLAEFYLQIVFAGILGDNTDTRTEEMRLSLHDADVNLLNVAVGRSDMNSLVEAGHHKLHRLVDHKLLGTTYGRRRERGEKGADLRARHTIIGGARETERAIIAHNTMRLDPSVLPLDMRRDGVPPTRFHMTKWAIEHGLVASSMGRLDIQAARMKLMPRWPGTFTEKGVRLLRTDTGAKREYINWFRYVSQDPRVLALMSAAHFPARMKPQSLDYDFLVDPNSPKSIWFVDLLTGDLIELTLVVDDPKLCAEATVADVVDLMEEDKLVRPALADQTHQLVGGIEQSQRGADEIADREHQAAVEALDKPPSNAALVANKAPNRQAEKGDMILGVPILVSGTGFPSNDGAEPPAEPKAEAAPAAAPPAAPTAGSAAEPTTESPAEPTAKPAVEPVSMAATTKGESTSTSKEQASESEVTMGAMEAALAKRRSKYGG